MPGDQDALGLLVDSVTRHMAEVEVTEDDHMVIQEVAHHIVRLVTRMTRPPGNAEDLIDAASLPKAWLTPEEEVLIPRDSSRSPTTP